MMNLRTNILPKLSIILVVLVCIDQYTKFYAMTPILNLGFFLSSFISSSPFYRIFCTLALLSLSLMIVTFIQFLSIKTAPYLAFALVLLEAGLIGNGMDRVRLGAVRDFIEIKVFHPSLILNLADLYQLASLALILFFIWQNPKKIWPEINLRSSYLPYPSSQLRIVIVSVLISILMSSSNFLLFMAYLKTNHIVVSFNELSLCYLLLTLLMTTVIGVFSLVWSHRVYGPFRAVVRYLNQLNHSDPTEIKIRRSDEMECANEILELIKEFENRRKRVK